MAGWDNGVTPPGGASFNAPLMDFSALGNLYNDVQQTQLTDQQKQLNQAKIAQIKQQTELSKAFAGGLPTDPATGQIDYRKAAGILAAKGDVAGAVNLLQQQPPPMSPMFGGQGQGQAGGQPQPQGQPQPAPQAGPQPMSVPARPLPPPAANSPRGDSGNGSTVTDIVTGKLPDQNQTTGQTIIKIAEVMGVDPNADLTPGQQKRAQGLLSKYAPDIAGTSGGSNLPPSANAVSPAPQRGTAAAAAGRTGAPTTSGAPVPAQAQPAPVQGAQPPQPAPQPQQPQQPIVPQVPLPKGFNDPQTAILALRAEAARMASNPRGAPQAQALNDWASRIEDSIKPMSVGAATTILDPRTGKPIYQGPAAAAYGSGGGETGQTLDADANEYRMTGKLPPNMGRGIQGQQQATAIRTRAAEQEIAEGGDVNDWPSRWQKFGTQASGLRSLEVRAAGLTLAENESKRLIPRVRDISDKISRTEYPNINSLIMAAKKGTGDPDVIKLGIAVESLVPVYARVLKPTGQIGQGDMARAHDILDKAWSKGQINAALDQMEVELDSAKSALKDTQEEYGNRSGTKKKDTDSSTSSGSSKAKTNTTPSGLNWSVE